MSFPTLYSLVSDFAKKKASGGPLTTFALLYGYGQALTASPATLKALQVSQDALTELDKVRESGSDRGLDFSLLKQVMNYLSGEHTAEGSRIPAEAALAEATAANGQEPDSLLLFIYLIHCHSQLASHLKQGTTFREAMEYASALPKQDAPNPAEDGEGEADAAVSAAEAASEGESSAEEVPQRHPYRHPERRKKPADMAADTESEASPQSGWESFRDLSAKCAAMRSNLRRTIFGQDAAINTFVRGCFHAGLHDTLKSQAHRPKAIFLFAGPPGVGKTMLAESAAKELALPFLRLNMSEYATGSSLSELIGYDRNYKTPKRGALTGFVQENKDCIVLFDEIEKADLSVIHCFLQILDKGEAQDLYEEKAVSFKNAILIFTTNVGRSLYESGERGSLSLLEPAVVLDALQKETDERGNPLFPAAICSRFSLGNVIMFNHLEAAELRHIAETNFDECARSVEESFGFRVSYDDEVSSMLLFSVGSRADARYITGKSSQFILNEVYRFAEYAAGRADLSRLKSFRFQLNHENSQAEVRELFAGDTADNVLLAADGLTVCSDSPRFRPICARTFEELEARLKEAAFSFAIVDPLLGFDEPNRYGLSLDDMDTEGMRCFRALRRDYPYIPVYLADSRGLITEADQTTFLEQGAAGILPCAEDYSEIIGELAFRVYLQQQMNKLSGGGKVLHFNSAQLLSEDGSEAVIEFHDFSIALAADADSRRLILQDAEKPKLRFHDIIGAKSAKDALQRYITELKNPKMTAKGKEPPKGILLYGPPGTGKTMLAKAMAGEAGVTFLPTTASSFMDKWVGEGEKRVRELFTAARKHAPAIIFIDEIDAIAKERTGEDKTETILNTLLTEMDGFASDPFHPVFVIAATNYPIESSGSSRGRVIDPALVRRFNNRVCVDLPKKDERAEFIRRWLSEQEGKKVSDEAVKNMAERTPGESLANLKNILAEAERVARSQGEDLNDTLLLNAMEQFYYGDTHQWKENYYISTATHESGHAYIYTLAGHTPSFLTIVSRGNFGGYMQHESSEETPSLTKEDLLWQIRTSLAGRAAEMVFYGRDSGINTGASSDLQKASSVALRMICDYGMGDDSLLAIGTEKMMSLPDGQLLRVKADALLREEMETTIGLIEKGRDKVARLSKELLAKNQLTGPEIEAILKPKA